VELRFKGLDRYSSRGFKGLDRYNSRVSRDLVGQVEFKGLERQDLEEIDL